MTSTIIAANTGAAIGTVGDSYTVDGQADRANTAPKLWYTAEKITYDGSDSDCYGEPCEPGTGFTMESGWVDMSWSISTLYPGAEGVAPEVWELHDGPLIEWLADTIIRRLGWVELNTDSPASATAGTSTTFYAEDFEQVDAYSGDSVRLAVHMEDVPPAIVSAVTLAIAYRQQCTRRGIPCNY
jgi:hypothetical protein